MDDDQFGDHALHESQHWWFTARRSILMQLTQELLPPTRDALVLEIGCGTGGNVAALAENYSAVGIDIAPTAIAIAKQTYPQLDFRCGTAPADILDLFEQARLVWLLDVLEHVEGDAKLLADLISKAKVGTCFAITVPADMALWSSHDEALQHYRRYSPESLEDLWRNLPCKTVLLAPLNRNLYWPIRFVRMLSRWRGNTLGNHGNDLKMPRPWVNNMLFWLFSLEGRSLVAALRNSQHRIRGHGVSLLAILQRN